MRAKLHTLCLMLSAILLGSLLHVLPASAGAFAPAAGVPTGSIVQWVSSSAPSGWLQCDGTAYSRTTYAALYAVCGTAYGVGDGSTTFNSPDYRGRCAIGVGTGSGLTARTLGATTGTETVTLTAAQSGLPSHTHTYQRGTTGADNNGTFYVQLCPSTNNASVGGVNNVTAADASQSHSSMQPSLASYFIVKY